MARQYSGTLGKVGNSQIAVSLHAASDAASCPLNWRLFVPESWDDLCAETNEQAEAIAARRTKVGIPDTIRHRTKWELALEMIDELAAWDHKPPVLVGDAGYGNATAFRRGLTEREIPYVLAVQATTTAHPGDAVPTTSARTGPGRPGLPRYRDKPQSLRDLAISAGRSELRHVTWRTGTKTRPNNPRAVMKSRFLALRIRPANRDIPVADDATLPECWLLAEWPPNTPAPTDYWISTLPADTPIKTLVRLAKLRWRIEHDYRELKTGLGLNNFEGRTHLTKHY